MKYCKNCGAEINEDAVICVKCGCSVLSNPRQTTNVVNNENQFCSHCGNVINNDAVVCLNCGCSIERKKTSSTSGLKVAAKVLMILSTILTGLYILPLAWMLPMTIVYCNKLKRNEPISTGFKVCIFLFANLIAGILLLCDKED